MPAKRSTIDIVKVLERWAAVAIAYAPIPRGMKRPRDTAIVELYNALAQAHQQIEGLEFTWIPCEERMPTAGKKVWAWCTAEGGFPFWGHWNWQEPIWVNTKGNGPYPVSHWAAIRWPEPPQIEEGRDASTQA